MDNGTIIKLGIAAFGGVLMLLFAIEGARTGTTWISRTVGAIAAAAFILAVYVAALYASAYLTRI